MKILLTGSFGNVGISTLKSLLAKDHDIVCFDLETSNNRKTKEEMLEIGEFQTFWGDITNSEDVNKVVKDVNCIIHLAAIIPPLSEKNPELTYKVNVEGTRNLLTAAKSSSNRPKIIMASSMGVYGVTIDQEPPRTAEDPLNPTNTYSTTKVKAEKLIQESGLSWLILRLAAVSVPELSMDMDSLSILYEVPLDQRIEFVDVRDVGTAFSNAVDLREINNEILLIGGGKENGCQIYQRQFIEGIFRALGIPMLPDSAFRIPEEKEDWFYTDWMETSRSQKLLHYQEHSFYDYIEDLKDNNKIKRFIIKIFSPIVKWILLRKSPYYYQ